MNVKKNLFMIVWGTVIVLLLGGCGYLLYRQRAAFVEAKTELANAEQALDGLNRRNPFPSPANVSVTETNLAVLTSLFEEFKSSLSANQIGEEAMEGARFLNVLEETRDDLNLHAMDLDVLVPTQFAYGFDSYVAGSIPVTEDVPRLTVQLRMVEALSELMFSNHVAAVTSIVRTPFEQPVEGAATGGAMPMGGMMGGEMFGGFGGGFGGGDVDAAAPALDVVESDLYSVEHFDVMFTAKGPSVMNVLEALASSKLFAVVTEVSAQTGADLGNLGSGFRAPTPGGRGGMMPGSMGGFDGPMGGFDGPMMGGMGGFNRPGSMMSEEMMMGGGPAGRGRAGSGSEAAGRSNLLHEDRKVAGDELLQVTMGVDVYRFKSQEEEEEADWPGAEEEGVPGMEPEPTEEPAPAAEETEL